MNVRDGLVLYAILLVGCSGTSAGTPARSVSPARSVAYGVPVPATVDYLAGDSARIQIEAGGQSFAVNADVQESWRMAFAPAPEGTRVTATLTDMDARLTNPMSAPQTADESAVEGPVIFTLDARGRATVESVPHIQPAVAQFLNGHGIAQGFFPRLPGRTVTPGQSWTDTVGYTTEEGGAKTTVESVITYTALGDSVDGTTTYLVVRTAGTTKQASAGTIAGTTFDQSVGGTTSGRFLWDRAAGVLHDLEYRSQLTGTMAVAVAPMPLKVSVTSTIRQRRVQP